ncbi:hypothetical protein T484DRAFT_1815383 [Baffinella frigidus]|nr:hypothetical protein T484DRAFT_1815383 [Cryptophyta sp. CCMP2293]
MATLSSTPGCSILSGDVILLALARRLRPTTAVFLTDVPGVFTSPPTKPHRANGSNGSRNGNNGSNRTDPGASLDATGSAARTDKDACLDTTGDVTEGPASEAAARQPEVEPEAGPARPATLIPELWVFTPTAT